MKATRCNRAGALLVGPWAADFKFSCSIAEGEFHNVSVPGLSASKHPPSSVFNLRSSVFRLPSSIFHLPSSLFRLQIFIYIGCPIIQQPNDEDQMRNLLFILLWMVAFTAPAQQVLHLSVKNSTLVAAGDRMPFWCSLLPRDCIAWLSI